MERKRISTISSLGVFVVFLWFLPSVGETKDIKVDCAKFKIQEKLKHADPGDTLLVSGTCNENIEILEEVHRITLDGQGSATINGGPPNAAGPNTILIRGKGILIKGFTITGGASGVSVLEGGTVSIESNIIQNTGRNGIIVNRHSSAEILNNTIKNNPGGDGISVNNHSHARIGFEGQPPALILAPNIIENNGEQGITIITSSHAQIFANVIRNNAGTAFSDGIFISKMSHADINGNTIDGNGRDGIRVQENSGANIGTDSTGETATVGDDTNTGNNPGFGIRCRVDGYASGNIGSLTGALGGQNFTQGCFDNVSP